MKKTGFYIIKDDFFAEVNDPYLKGNKEQNRPHYYCFEDSENGIYWMIPLSSRIDKYQRIIDKRLAAGKPCDTLYIVELDNNRKNVFLRWNLSRGFSAKHNVSENSVQNICRAVSPQRMRIIGSMVFFYL